MSRIAVRSMIMILWILMGFLLAGCVTESLESQSSTPTIFSQSVSVSESTPTVDGGGSGRIVFSSYREGESEIFTMSVDGSGMTRLTTDTARLNQPTWPPRMAYKLGNLCHESRWLGSNQAYAQLPFL
jgi:hypothetical protein